jgi:hypothetical protein
MRKYRSQPAAQDARFPRLALQIDEQAQGAIWLENALQILKADVVTNAALIDKAMAAKQIVEKQRAHPRRIMILGRSGVPRVALAAALVSAADVDQNPESTRSYAGPQLMVSPLPPLNFAKVVDSPDDRRKHLLSALDSDYGVLLLTTPFVQDEQELVQDYAALIGARSIKTGAVLLLGIGDARHQAAVENLLKNAGIPLIAVAEVQGFADLVGPLRRWLDPQLAASIYCPGGAKTPSRYPGAENSAPHSDSDLLAGLRANLGGIEAVLREETARCDEFDSNADELARQIAAVGRELKEIDTKLASAEKRRHAQEQLLAKIKAAARDSAVASDTGSLPYPAQQMKREAGAVFDAGWESYCNSIRIGALADTDGLWLIWEDSRHAFAQRSLEDAYRWGDYVIRHWILGEESIREAPRVLHSEICDQIRANYEWIQRQWKQHHLRASHTPKAPANLADHVKRTITDGIETSTEALVGAGWAIVTGALVGGAFGAAGGVAAVKAGVISSAALAAPIAIVAGLAAILAYAYWEGQTRDKIIAAVRTCLQKACDAQRDRMREMFCTAAAVEFNVFSRKVRAALRLEILVVKREQAALDKEQKQKLLQQKKLESEREEKVKQIKDRQRQMLNDRDALLALLNAEYLTTVQAEP